MAAEQGGVTSGLFHWAVKTGVSKVFLSFLLLGITGLAGVWGVVSWTFDSALSTVNTTLEQISIEVRETRSDVGQNRETLSKVVTALRSDEKFKDMVASVGSDAKAIDPVSQVKHSLRPPSEIGRVDTANPSSKLEAFHPDSLDNVMRYRDYWTTYISATTRGIPVGALGVPDTDAAERSPLVMELLKPYFEKKGVDSTRDALMAYNRDPNKTVDESGHVYVFVELVNGLLVPVGSTEYDLITNPEGVPSSVESGND